MWYNVYNMYDTCGKHLLPKAKLHDNESSCAIPHTGVLQQIVHLSPFGFNKLTRRTRMYSDDTQPGRAVLIDPRISACCPDSIAGPC